MSDGTLAGRESRTRPNALTRLDSDDRERLQTLDGVGPVTADRLAQEFKSLEEIVRTALQAHDAPVWRSADSADALARFEHVDGIGHARARDLVESVVEGWTDAGDVIRHERERGRLMTDGGTDDPEVRADGGQPAGHDMTFVSDDADKELLPVISDLDPAEDTVYRTVRADRLISVVRHVDRGCVDLAVHEDSHAVLLGTHNHCDGREGCDECDRETDADPLSPRTSGSALVASKKIHVGGCAWTSVHRRQLLAAATECPRSELHVQLVGTKNHAVVGTPGGAWWCLSRFHPGREDDFEVDEYDESDFVTDGGVETVTTGPMLSTGAAGNCALCGARRPDGVDAALPGHPAVCRSCSELHEARPTDERERVPVPPAEEIDGDPETMDCGNGHSLPRRLVALLVSRGCLGECEACGSAVAAVPAELERRGPPVSDGGVEDPVCELCLSATAESMSGDSHPHGPNLFVCDDCLHQSPLETVSETVIGRLRDCWSDSGNRVLGSAFGAVERDDLEFDDWDQMIVESDGLLAVRVRHKKTPDIFVGIRAAGDIDPTPQVVSRFGTVTISGGSAAADYLRAAAGNSEMDLDPVAVEDTPLVLRSSRDDPPEWHDEAASEDTWSAVDDLLGGDRR